jgi:ornithine lipid ester-linked acyl 2-hydroxylase
MIPAIIVIVILLAIFFTWLKEPRIFLFLFHKIIFSARKGTALNIDKTVHFPDSILLEQNWKVIKAELDQVIMDKYTIPKFHQVDQANYKISFDTGPAWKTIVLKAYNGWFKSNCDLFPKTRKLLEKMPSVSTAIFSILEPHVQIPEHTGKLNGILRYHLALKVPSTGQCFITVNGANYYWVEGEGILFNDTYLHAVTNETDEPRVVLFLDINKKSSSFGNYINKFMLHLVVISPLFKRALKSGKIKVD